MVEECRCGGWWLEKGTQGGQGLYDALMQGGLGGLGGLGGTSRTSCTYGGRGSGRVAWPWRLHCMAERRHGSAGSKPSVPDMPANQAPVRHVRHGSSSFGIS